MLKLQIEAQFYLIRQPSEFGKDELPRTIVTKKCMYYFLGSVAILLGIGLILKTEWIIENFGTSAWAEEKFGGSGGGRMLYKLIGLALIFIGFMLITDLFNAFLMATVGKLFIR